MRRGEEGGFAKGGARDFQHRGALSGPSGVKIPSGEAKGCLTSTGIASLDDVYIRGFGPGQGVTGALDVWARLC